MWNTFSILLESAEEKSQQQQREWKFPMLSFRILWKKKENKKNKNKNIFVCAEKAEISKKNYYRRKSEKERKTDRGKQQQQNIKKNPQQHPGNNQIDFQSGVVCVRDKLCSVSMQKIIIYNIYNI